MQSVSTHAPLAGSDGHLVVDRHSVALFQPTLPLRGATVVLGLDSRGLWFQPTLPLRGATRPLGFFARLPRFNPRSPCGERQAARSSSRPSSCRFNPRSPCGERLDAALGLLQQLVVSTHAPLAGSDVALQPVGAHDLAVSTHAPLAGSDRASHVSGNPRHSFQPTLPLRGATVCCRADILRRVVSTHAPLAGSDDRAYAYRRRNFGFNPRSPCGERLGHIGIGRIVFVSTHAPLAGSDSGRARATRPERGFNPRSPCGERRRSARPSGARRLGFNPRSPCGERPLHLVNVALRAYHMHDVFHPNASSDELRPSETNQKAVRTSQGIPDSPQFAPPIIPTAYS